jgi:uncharacterized membrane protein
MLSAVDPPTTMASMRRNMRADGLFHAATWLCTVLGVIALWRNTPSGAAAIPGWVLVGDVVFGWGVFNLVEGLLDHEIFGLHHVREGARSASYDLTFLLLGGLEFIVLGLWLRSIRRARARP